jgi:hypothetical protein
VSTGANGGRIAGVVFEVCGISECSHRGFALVLTITQFEFHHLDVSSVHSNKFQSLDRVLLVDVPGVIAKNDVPYNFFFGSA